MTMATAKAATGAKKRAPRRKKLEVGSKGLSPAEAGQAPDDAKALVEHIASDGGVVVGSYKDPLGGHATVVALLPIDKVEPTPYQRDRSETHVKKLANAMERIDRFLDPLIAVRVDGKYWTPNGNHRLGAMKLLGMKTITALVMPDPDVAYQILALNTEKAHNLKERSLEVIRMYRGIVGAKGGKESDYTAIFEEPHFITCGACYEKRPRYSAGAYAPILRRIETFQDLPIEKALALREKRADALLAFDDDVVAQVAAMKARGLDSPYLKNFVVARVNYLRFKKGDGPFDWEETISKMHASVKKMDTSKVNKEDLARMGGAPAEADES